MTRISLRIFGAAMLLATAIVCAPARAADAPAPEKKPAWETTASLGATITQGNSDTLLFTAQLISLRKWEQNEVTLGVEGAYGENSSIKNNESLRAYSQWNRLFNERLYGFLRAEALHDAVADVEYRITLSPGAGYYFIKNDRTRLSGEVGPGYVIEQQGGRNSQYLTFRAGERFEFKINEKARVWQSLEFLPQVDEMSNFILNAEIGLETSITDHMKLRVYLQDTYDNEPAPGREENDLKLVAAVGYTF